MKVFTRVRKSLTKRLDSLFKGHKKHDQSVSKRAAFEENLRRMHEAVASSPKVSPKAKEEALRYIEERFNEFESAWNDVDNDQEQAIRDLFDEGDRNSRKWDLISGELRKRESLLDELIQTVKTEIITKLRDILGRDPAGIIGINY
mmetsp:Transcript_17662/g.20483  ORF Transcript_17662/g.20483 Transcript_17662/m.20483 type:complete len:146 (+) Transcript_17662:3-440(+)|eukprot:CAMPEP_0184065838 /NCGR_PEP_ID=MMETSP0957-20130417/3041_1 /TAXON_ID=627963 /ORGANISM="Aplanochytrium sp, Strain PBS07" /LENGTH=145 /DNA_ID=CAMNT_0026363717 /DNA_START=37 /DNA_END=474 /DNA_ORIENTATION=+